MKTVRHILCSATLLALSSTAAMPCSETAIGCNEVVTGTTTYVYIMNTLTSTLPAGSWVAWKDTGGGGGTLTLSAALAYKGTVQATRPSGGSYGCTAYLVRP